MSWFAQGVVYQIFPERFAIGRSRSLADKIHEGRYLPSAIPRDWDYQPQRYEETPYEFMGGDLWGVREHLDYLQGLGIGTLYLTPFMFSPTNHKYDTLDYCRVDPGMGDEKAFQELVTDIHERGMHIIIDIALNHISDQHPLFQSAITDPGSLYRDFFRFIEYPFTYECWTGHCRMPELNLTHPRVQEYFITGEDSVIHYWMRQGIDGIRLDCANDLGTDIAALIRQEVKTVNPGAVVLGEVSNFAAEWCRFLDGTQSYFLSHTIYSFLQGRVDGEAVLRNTSAVFQGCGRLQACQSLLMLASHDTPRALDTFQFDRGRLYLGLVLQFTLPGVPMLYYGDENGMQGGPDPANRCGMDWKEENWDTEIRSFILRLIAIRNQHPELQQGDWQPLYAAGNQDVIAFLRTGDNPWENTVVAVNRSERSQEFRLFITASHLYSNTVLRDQLSQTEYTVHSSFIDISLAPLQARILCVWDEVFPSYRFYKGRQVKDFSA